MGECCDRLGDLDSYGMTELVCAIKELESEINIINEHIIDGEKYERVK